MEKEKTNLYLLSIVGIVAVVGIVVLTLNAGTGTDISGQALGIGSKKMCKIYCTDDFACFKSGTECGSLQWSSRTTKIDCSIGEDAMWTICSEDDEDGDGDGYDYTFSFWGRTPLDYYS